MPDDIWLVDLDSNKITPPSGLGDTLPALPEPEGTILKNHLKQVSEKRKMKRLTDSFFYLMYTTMFHLCVL